MLGQSWLIWSRMWLVYGRSWPSLGLSWPILDPTQEKATAKMGVIGGGGVQLFLPILDPQNGTHNWHFRCYFWGPIFSHRLRGSRGVFVPIQGPILVSCLILFCTWATLDFCQTSHTESIFLPLRLHPKDVQNETRKKIGPKSAQRRL